MQRVLVTPNSVGEMETLQAHEHLINGLPPTRIPAGSKYRVLPERQLLIAGDLTVEGTLEIDGDLVLL